MAIMPIKNFGVVVIILNVVVFVILIDFVEGFIEMVLKMCIFL